MNGEGGRLGSLAERVTGHQRPRSREVPLSYAPHHRPNCRDLDFRFPGSGHGEVRLVRDGRPVGLGGMGLLRDVKDVPPLPLLRTPPGFCPSPSAPSFPLSGVWAEAVYDSPGSAKSEVFLGGWVESESTPTASLSMGTGQRRTFKTTLQRRWLGWEGLDEGFRSLSDCTQS